MITPDMWFIAKALGAVVVLAALYVGYVYLSAYHTVSRYPKEDVFLCNFHGPIRKQDLIYFLNVPYCPICFHEKMKKAEQPR